MTTQIEKLLCETTRIGGNAGQYMVTDQFWRGVHNTAAETVLLFPPDWASAAQPILIQLTDVGMPKGTRANWREWSVGDQLGCKARFVKAAFSDPWHGVGEG